MDYQFDGIIFDINGVLEYQGKVYPGAPELLDYLRSQSIEIRILTNSTLKSRKSCCEKLNRTGFTVYEHEVITASFATARYLKTLDPRSCWVMLKREGLQEFKDFNQDTEHPEYIVLGDYREDFNFENMNRAVALLLGGTKLIVMITEKVDRSLGGVELTVGAYGRMLEDAAGIRATYIGKPNRYVFDMILDTMTVDRNRVVMVGDKVSSDIIGAHNAGLKSVLVKTGEFRQSDLVSDIQPDFVYDRVAQIRELF
ncbi:MAG: HAD-IIA family hydrolase [Desulfobacterales bacterium]|nr:HAD-IIA family hydrolase [Desulfobacterales bacterium]MDD4072686.1 HAD-IIA family hydrolase [Desulfobacterales bacterium]MDD4391879.1 HAD-IIA family hydrolase [Desulfobacterales bacterium]